MSGVGNAITAGSVAIANIMFIYSTRQDWMLGIYGTIIGTAYVPGMLLTNFFVKKIGKKNLLLSSKVINIGAIAGQFLAIKTNSMVLFILFAYLNILLCTPAGMAGSAMTADIWDYQQYKTGERLDGFSGVFGLFLTPINAVLGMLIPTLYAIYGFTSDWDILYEVSLRNPVLNITLLIGVIANVLSAIPYLFYDLTETKHRQIIEELKQRELEQDGGMLEGSQESGGNDMLVDNAEPII